ncbi:hypothetical protein ILUMI_03295 [Ignelater luminosus]|uniref:Sulfotransferase domain-containing protein n=1 Tax=Ignelater luminosus TaxID=2038154 RepID=A0A8K0DM33_IGNLU|nr:hypothetical protein ILUMI_03295 [Ignelater luminosus]
MNNCDYEEVNLDDEVGQIIKDGILSEFYNKFIRIGKDGSVFSNLYLYYAEEIKNFEVYDDDVWVISYPKTGATWTQEMVWMIANNLDFEGSKIPLKERFPFLEMSVLMERMKMYENKNVSVQVCDASSIEFARQVPRPRFIKTHLPFSLLPQQIQNGTRTPKLVWVIRNPKDTCVSYYHHGTLLMTWRVCLENFAKVFMADKSHYGSYWGHFWSYWNRRHLPNLLVNKYEDMKADLPSTIKVVAKFLNKEISEEQVHLLCNHLSFQSMKKNPAVNFEDRIARIRSMNLIVKDKAFIRSGTVAKYKEELSPETIAKFDEWIKQNIAGTEVENEYIFHI